MSTAAQLAANQANAQLSTGPVTETGRAASSRNNLRHGFRSQTVLLPGDDPAEYEALLAELTAHFAPLDIEIAREARPVHVVREENMDLTEQRFVREMADAEWCLRRLRAQLEDVLTRRIEALTLDHPDADPTTLQSLAVETLGPATGTSYGTWLRYEAKFERQYNRACKDWTLYQKDRLRARDKNADVMMREVLFRPTPDQLASNVQNSDAHVLSAQVAAQKTSAPPQTPRNAHCPCGSGDKFKRCCGKSAPPVLNMAA